MKTIFSTGYQNSWLNLWLLILRIGASILMLTHGFPKLMKVIEGNMQFGDPLGLGATTSLILATFAEAFCSIFIMLGLATRLATIPLIITMATAAFIVHANDPFSRQEMPLLYLLIYITLLVTGAGKYSVDHAISKR
jgi:putative oxidoreductase